MIIFSPEPPGFQQGVIFLQHWPLVTRLHIPILPENSCSCFHIARKVQHFERPHQFPAVSSSFRHFPRLLIRCFQDQDCLVGSAILWPKVSFFFLYYSSVQALLMSPVATLYHQLLLPLKTYCEKSLTSLFSYFVLSPSPSAESWPNHHSRNWIWQ